MLQKTISMAKNGYVVSMESLIKKLSPLQSEIIKKIYFDGLTETEIARSKKVTRQYIHNLKSQALKTLRKEISNL